jgi:hypothetical protein
MTNRINLVLILTILLCRETFAQSATTPNDELIQGSADKPAVSYVYVSSTPKGGSVNEIEAFAAAPNGELTVVSGSPFRENVTSMVVNGKYLFAVNSNGIDIDSYRIEANGALRYATSADTDTVQSNDCSLLGPLFLDHTGASLYDMVFNGSDCATNTYETFSVNKSTGRLNDPGNSGGNDWLYLPASFIGNNVYAYSASCLEDMYWGIFGFERSSDGLLTEIGINAEPPTPPQGYFYCPSQAAADPYDHVAISMQPVNQQDFSPDRLPQLATYTADAKGNLNTKSTSSNMPQTSVISVTDLNMSPSGKLLAVGGTGGLEIFHFNGGNPITPYTGLLTKDEIDQVFWDNQNHLYAISRTADKLYVFTITPTSHSEAPASPHTISHPQNLIVQPEL